MERVYADRDNHSALGIRPVRNSAERPEDRARQRNRNGAQLVMQEHRNAVQRNAAIAPHIAWQQRALMNFPNWQAQPYTRKELLILKTLKGSLFVYVVASLLNPIASGSDLTILYLILPSITGMFTMYALVCEQMAYLVPFLLALVRFHAFLS
ncbi:unnamed protein product [Toxocara canis]|uniref:Transmembrane protein n=1 Tax=Toxocara canis TaxID=6265 RepID=A0A183VE00_TOXCA|nr:unnamed protein product [Toxocara canis]